MMSGPVVVFVSLWAKPLWGFSIRSSQIIRQRPPAIHQRLFASSSSSPSLAASVENGISRLETLQTLLSKYGAPGSKGCSKGDGDLIPIGGDGAGTASVKAEAEAEEMSNLHPLLHPIARSSSSGHYICGLRRAPLEEDDEDWNGGVDSSSPWPIVESGPGKRGMRLLSLNSEHVMRRIAAECDFRPQENGRSDELIELYNADLGKGLLNIAQLDVPYEPGSVEKLGYGVEKYVLLKVAPFPDLYELMALEHASRGSRDSSLIAAEASNGKFPGFGSTFRFYSNLLASFPQRDEESRDAARMCLRLPLSTVGMDDEDFREIAIRGLFADDDDDTKTALVKLERVHDKIRRRERDDENSTTPGVSSNKTPRQIALGDASHLLDKTSLLAPTTETSDSCNWAQIRPELADIYASIGLDDLANYVNPQRLLLSSATTPSQE